jgi:hypothetical protein
MHVVWCFLKYDMSCKVFAMFSVVTFALLFSFNELTVIQPYMRGFFCDDQNLMYPYRDDSISTIVVTILSTAPPAIIVIIFIYSFQSLGNSNWWKRSQNHAIFSILFVPSRNMMVIDLFTTVCTKKKSRIEGNFIEKRLLQGVGLLNKPRR